MNPLAVHPVLLGVDFLVLVGVYAFCRAGRAAIAVGLIIAKAIGLLVGLVIVSMDTYQFEQFMLFQTFLPVIIGLFLLGTVIYGVFVIGRPQLNPATKNNTEVPVGKPGPQGTKTVAKLAWYIALLFAMATGFIDGGLIIALGHRDPPQIRFFDTHQEGLTAYALRVIAGQVAQNGSRGDYAIWAPLEEIDVSHVQCENGMVIITSAFMPTDAVPELIYSPKGPAPVLAQFNGRQIAYLDIKNLDGGWYYVLWDD